jgi:hypothetical protein
MESLIVEILDRNCLVYGMVASLHNFVVYLQRASGSLDACCCACHNCDCSLPSSRYRLRHDRDCISQKDCCRALESEWYLGLLDRAYVKRVPLSSGGERSKERALVQVPCLVLPVLYVLAEYEAVGVVVTWIFFDLCGQVDAASRVCHVLGRMSQLV